MGWFFKGLPSGKRVAPIYPMETPNGAANTVGGRFIPSGLLLAQDFPMSQLARRENAPHRAAFVTSLSRLCIRRLLGNLPPFHRCLSAERFRIVPYGTSPPMVRFGLMLPVLHRHRKNSSGEPHLET